MGLADKVLEGNIQAAARLITGLEDELPAALEQLDIIYPHTGKAHIIGITGAPGIGKSTLVSSLISLFRQRQMSVGVIAIDPTSPFTGGAILGDRIRMQHHASDKEVFIRSLATRGWSGGLAKVALSAIHVMDAMGKEIILVETVGVGQSEVDIARVADTTVVILSAESGDEIQVMKAGIMEIADIFVINKADKGGAEYKATEIEVMLGMKTSLPGDWRPPIVLTEAISGKGADKLIDGIVRHREYLVCGSGLAKRRQERAKQELVTNIECLVKDYFFRGLSQGGFMEKLVSDFVLRQESPRSAARKIMEMFIQQYQSVTPPE